MSLPPFPGAKIKRVAAIVTEYRCNSHADVILGRLLGDFGYTPRVEIISLYTDQVPANDMSRGAAAHHGIPIYPTIRETIRAEQSSSPIEGVLIIGEHGDYPNNAKGQTLYPRRRFLEETLLALDEESLNVPIFSDKHLSYDWQDALWMYNSLKARGIPFMGGSSIPHTDPIPGYNLSSLLTVSEILVISHSTLIEAYGFHAVEVLQSLAEKREGGESGVQSVEVAQGLAVWDLMDRKGWPEDLLLHALSAYPNIPSLHPRELEPNPTLFMIEYTDGTKGYVVQFEALVEQWGFAFRHSQGIVSSRCDSDLDRPFRHFERLTQLIEDFFISRQPPFPMERTLLTTGLIGYAVDSLYYGKKLETPELHFAY
ncbi:hypothetical protein [Cohnella sp.]|uniref:hypothetical protein n=1 Tax=Cohnella sp. TaxID=1883426 RepID=UPI003563D441